MRVSLPLELWKISRIAMAWGSVKRYRATVGGPRLYSFLGYCLRYAKRSTSGANRAGKVGGHQYLAAGIDVPSGLWEEPGQRVSDQHVTAHVRSDLRPYASHWSRSSRSLSGDRHITTGTPSLSAWGPADRVVGAGLHTSYDADWVPSKFAAGHCVRTAYSICYGPFLPLYTYSACS
jgi:hypothetical protein